MMKLLLVAVLSLKRMSCTEQGFRNTVSTLFLLFVHITAVEVRQSSAVCSREPCGNKTFGRQSSRLQ